MNAGERRRGTGLWLVLIAGLLGAALWWWWRGGGDVAGPEQAQHDAGPGSTQAFAGLPQGRPELVLSPRFGDRAAIAGTVRDPQGQPVAGAQVCAWAQSERLASSDTRRPWCATSERDGHYRIEGLFPVRHRVTASAPGYAPGLYSGGEGTSRREWVELRPKMEALGIDISLEDGGVEIHGIVKDLSGGAIEGAQVMGGQSFTVTDAEGMFSMWVREGGTSLWASADGYADAYASGKAPGHLFELFLTPEAVLVGKVVRASEGTPIEGAQVHALGGGRGWSGNSAFTDANGEFRIDRLDPGAYKPRAEADDVFGLAEEQVILGLGETSAPIVIQAHPAFHVEGTIVTEGGGSCDDGSVYLRDPAQGREVWIPIERDGVAHKGGVLPGEYQVRVSCEGFVPAERYEHVVVTDKSVTGLKWEVTKGLAIRGVVVDASGKPAAKVRINTSPKVDPSKPRAQQTSAWGRETGADGRFEITGLLPGEYRLGLSSWGSPRALPSEPVTVTLPEGQDLSEVRIELPASGEVRGTVRDENGRPVASATVRLTDGVHHEQERTADDGTFHFKSVNGGDYRATAQLGWWGDGLRAPGTSDDDVQGARVEVREGKVATVNLVVESSSGRITGVVRDEDGGAVADAFVEASRESDSAAASKGRAMRFGRWGDFFKTPNLTDQDGRFALENLPASKHTLRAYRKGGGEAILEHVEIGGDVVLTIASTGRMSGTVNVRGGAPPDEFTVVIRDETTGYGREDRFFRTGGTWSFAEVPPGSYKVSVNAGAGTAEVRTTVGAGQETSGLRIELAPKVTVRGTVVDLEGNPVSGMRVDIYARNMWTTGGADEQKLNVTDESGRFEVSNAPTGVVTVVARPGSGGEYERASMPVTLSAEASVVELAPIKVTQRRVKDGEARGDLGIKLKETEPGADPLTRQLIVAHVRPGGPAAAAGVQAGDEITSVDGRDVTGANSYLYDSLTGVPEGTTVTLGLARGASVAVTAGKKP